MRTVSGRRNRTVLVLSGLLMMLAAAWVASAATPVLDLWPAGDPVLPHGDSRPADIAAAHSSWLLPTAVAASLLVTVGGILLLIAQIPTAPPRESVRVTDRDDHLLGSIAPGVLERALSDALGAIPGVTDASLRLGGGAAEPWIQSTVSVSEESETGWVAETVRRRLIDDVTTVLGTAPVRVDLLVRLSSARAPRTARVGEHSTAAPAETALV
ncbi:hypothetical protein [Brachybacterium sp. YJGR34]|uniref:hypothetical protein n=1 Tax=Brachybacterium sp. YJGR34 TaxID=2059911 RepID=UPI000E0B16DC|nr:hypothetical protein [Brachybacterium sp. YJGR34]